MVSRLMKRALPYALVALAIAIIAMSAACSS